MRKKQSKKTSSHVNFIKVTSAHKRTAIFQRERKELGRKTAKLKIVKEKEAGQHLNLATPTQRVGND